MGYLFYISTDLSHFPSRAMTDKHTYTYKDAQMLLNTLSTLSAIASVDNEAELLYVNRCTVSDRLESDIWQ